MKTRKKLLSYVRVVYDGGVAAQIEVALPYDEAKRQVAHALKHRDILVLDTVNGQEEIADDVMFVDFSRVLFVVVAKPNDSQIKLASGIVNAPVRPGVQ